MNYHTQIMNLGPNCTHAGSPREDVMRAYMEGHQRACLEAAEIATEADSEVERLRAALKDIATAFYSAPEVLRQKAALAAEVPNARNERPASAGPLD